MGNEGAVGGLLLVEVGDSEGLEEEGYPDEVGCCLKDDLPGDGQGCRQRRMDDCQHCSQGWRQSPKRELSGCSNGCWKA